MSLCESCAAQEGILDISGFGLADSILPSAASVSSIVEGPDTCSRCGFTRGKFQQTGRLGCSQCYLTFSDDILNKLGPMHRGLRHLGKYPAGFEGDDFSERLLSECQERLEEAIQEENYEEAARIRDEIRQLSARVHNDQVEEFSDELEGGKVP